MTGVTKQAGSGHGAAAVVGYLAGDTSSSIDFGDIVKEIFTIWDGTPNWWRHTGRDYLFFKVASFFAAQVCGCHLAVNHSFSMILGSQETLDQRRFHAPKIIEKRRVSSELSLGKEHHVEGILKSGFFVILQIYNRKSYCKKKTELLKKGSWGWPVWCPISYVHEYM